MWVVDHLEVKRFTLHWIEGGQESYTKVSANGIRLIDAIEYMELSEDSGSVINCEDAELPYFIRRAGEVIIRRLGSMIVLLPDFDNLRIEFPDEIDGRIPPDYLTEVGAPLFTERAWHQLRTLSTAVLESTAYPMVSATESVRLLQWNSPAHILGQCPDPPVLNRDLILAVTKGDVEAEVDAVQDAISRWFDSNQPVEVVDYLDEANPIEFHLDLPKYPSWSPYVRIAGELCLRIMDGPVLKRS